MGDALQKVKAGDKLRMPAATYNAFIDAARDFQNRQRNADGSATPGSDPSGTVVLVKNTSGMGLDRYAVLGISGPIIVAEKFLSRPSTAGDGAQIDLLYFITCTDDDLAAKSALISISPTVYNGLVRQSARIEPVGPGLWDGTVRYAPFAYQPPQTGQSTFTFDTGGGTQHVTQSLQTVGKYPPSTAPDFGGAVGVTHDNVEGVDITIPIYQFSETHYLDPTLVTPSYQGTLFALTGKVNNAVFRTLNAGECLFLGASGSRRGTSSDADWEITFRFAGSPNVTGLTIGSITGIAKKGWEYMWVRYADSEDATAKVLVKKPVAVYIEKVYEQANYDLLGIGS